MTKDTRDLLGLIDRFAHLRVAVWGDIILDEHLYGFTRRISREAPVLILSYQKKELSLGGAGNAVLNLAALGVEPVCVAVVGADEAGRAVRRILRSRGVADGNVFTARGFATPLKTRILAGEENTRKQQILRIDREGRVPDDAALKRGVRAALLAAARDCDALIVSDYHSRTVREDVYPGVLAAFRKAGAPVTVDSRFRLLSFPGATLAAPNEPEVEEALGTGIGEDLPALHRAGKSLLRRLRSSAVLITRGSRGMALYEKARPPRLYPVFGSTDIVDVTGAGDTVIAVLTAALAAGASFDQAARLADFAGGVVVMKRGAAVLSPLELKQAVVTGL